MPSETKNLVITLLDDVTHKHSSRGGKRHAFDRPSGTASITVPMFDDVSTANTLVARSIGEERLPGTRISTVAISNTLTPRVFPSISNFYPPIPCLLPEAESLVPSPPFLSPAQPASLRLSTSFAPQGRKSESEIITVGSADII